MNKARNKAWADVQKLPEVKAEIEAAKEADRQLRRAQILQRKGKSEEAEAARQSALTLRNNNVMF